MAEKKFKEVSPKTTLPEIEETILKFWEENDIFQKSLAKNSQKKKYSFYDGPPFATGTPHYGHIVASTLKDVVPRYQTMRGFNVPRRWGWDCHGLPIENIAEKELGIKQKKDILKLGVAKFNDFCRSKVLEYADEWKKVITRLGRWADMDNSYKTMDLEYMESVWWVFKELYQKGLIYEGYRSMHICPRCETTLSQSEVAEGYKMVKDLSVTVKFELIDEPGTYLLAWTTTPWTLLGNAALAVNRKIKYLKVQDGQGQYYLVAKTRAASVFSNRDYKVVEEMTGDKLVGLKYQPLFLYPKQNNIQNLNNGFIIYDAQFVTTDEGTGVVHIAPAFGEDDMNLGREKQLPLIQHIGMDGVIKEGYGEFSGLSVKPIDNIESTDVEIIKYLDKEGLLFSKEKYEHSYPHCWRCETPLLNYATSSWFVRVTDVKDEALELAKEIDWFPKHIKTGRFGKWLEGARDWAISRQRFWASAIPIWVCDKESSHKQVIGSVKELEELSGVKIEDIHKHIVDGITFKCRKCNGQMGRVPDVLDTWFDSGSMPYAQMHYPFANKEQFEQNFPADFIAEGADQTRAWFYYLHVLSTVLFNKVAFKNVVVNGIVLAEDGKKMSKRLQNYPDPMLMFQKYGADCVRFYLMSSPVVAADNLNFSEKEVAEIYRGMFRMLLNSYSFFVLYANIDNFQPTKADSKNLLDRWITSEMELLIDNVTKSMESNNLLKASRQFPVFIDNLSNWYIRRSRKRFWKSENDQDKNSAYQTLYDVLITLTKLMAPFCPFITDDIYRNLTGQESVHLTDYPVSNPGRIDQQLVNSMNRVREIVLKALAIRNEAKIKVRQPLKSLSYNGEKLNEELEGIIADEVNVKNLINNSNIKEVVLDTELTPDLIREGEAREIIRQIQQSRKEAKFNIDDRIIVAISDLDEQAQELIFEFRDDIRREVLADKIEFSVMTSRDYQGQIKINQKEFKLELKRF